MQNIICKCTLELHPLTHNTKPLCVHVIMIMLMTPTATATTSAEMRSTVRQAATCAAVAAAASIVVVAATAVAGVVFGAATAHASIVPATAVEHAHRRQLQIVWLDRKRLHKWLMAKKREKKKLKAKNLGRVTDEIFVERQKRKA